MDPRVSFWSSLQTIPSDTPRTDPRWSSIPTDLLLAELSRRDDANERPACGSGKKGSYDTGIHVFALFLILTLSTLCT